MLTWAMRFLADSVTTLILGLMTGGFLGMCYSVWRFHRNELTKSQRRYLQVSFAVGGACGLYLLALVIISIVRIIQILS